MANSERPRVFISNSRLDKEGHLFIHKLFGISGVGFEPYFYSDWGHSAPHAERIRDEIQKSVALIVLLSGKMQANKHTRSWVPYEVGIASSLGLAIIVIESSKRAVNLPVPGATHYLQRPPAWDGSNRSMWTVLAKTAGKLTPREPGGYGEGFWSNVLTGLSNLATQDQDETGEFVVADCTAENCRTKFWVPMSIRQAKRHPCPACRQPNAGFLVSLQETLEEAQKRHSGDHPALPS